MMGKGGSTEIRETSQEKAAAEVALEQWKLYRQELRPFEDLFIQKVGELNAEGRYDRLAGEVNLGYQQAFGHARKQTADALSASGVDPGSGKFRAALRDSVSDQVVGQIDTVNRGQSSQQESHIAGLQDVAAIGSGQKADTLGGFNDIAGAAQSRAASDAYTHINDRLALGGAVGTGIGIATRSYGTPEKKDA
ncbi:hypothetical protein AAGU66_08610 [Edwardsiella ictaluri]|nr:hypothetical protein [Edwardsiella ictaluri]UCQ46282.1 hypothetical protein DB741_09045 [Edwardsiella ictaluri]UCQ49551.1 hypothetical protein DB731_09005 [Edwardsiella ictaluri]UYB60275.1 hypothetical protein N8I66_09145 [Edwardsiella ictaluri]UYB63501.1 hypothetical protein N8I67_09140 [Edwardsiella ictaluri]WFO09816.1 hypothetical protein MAY76_17280 [Edwardsiella ictaluri]